jgi:hypothetical protein
MIRALLHSSGTHKAFAALAGRFVLTTGLTICHKPESHRQKDRHDHQAAQRNPSSPLFIPSTKTRRIQRDFELVEHLDRLKYSWSGARSASLA